MNGHSSDLPRLNYGCKIECLHHLNHTIANPMTKKEHFHLSTISCTTAFLAAPETLYSGFQTSSWQKDHYWGKFRLTLNIDSKKTFAPLAKVTFGGLWLQLPQWERSLHSSEMWWMLFWVENHIRRFTCHLTRAINFFTSSKSTQEGIVWTKTSKL